MAMLHVIILFTTIYLTYLTSYFDPYKYHFIKYKQFFETKTTKFKFKSPLVATKRVV